MRKFILLKSRKIDFIDNFLKKKFSKKYNFSTLKLPGIPCFLHPISVACVNYLDFYYPGHGIKMLVSEYSQDGDRSIVFFDRKEFARLGKKAIHNKRLFNRVLKDYDKIKEDFYRVIFRLEKEGINEKRLYNDYLEFIRIYLTEWAIVYSVTGPINHGYGDIFLKKLLTKYRFSSYVYDAIEVFTKSSHNFLRDEAKSLERIVGLIKKSSAKNVKNLDILKKQYSTIYKELEKHQRKYHWITNNYKFVNYLDKRYFFERIRNILNHASPNRKRIISRRRITEIQKNIDKEDIVLLKRMSIAATLQDQRKKINLIANYWLLEFLKIIAKKMKTPLSLLRFTSLWEVIDLLEGKKINTKEISKRRNGCFSICLQDLRDYWLTGKEYKLFKNKIFKERRESKSEINGIVANSGKVSGRVKIVLNVAKEGKKIKHGDILISSMTRPEFMPLLNLVSAIITDEGGITCHAAIISRELNIPCIIGTKIATEVLKDGDLVEVDANKGIVRILKK